MQYSQLIARIQADIYNNGAELITGDILQGDLLAIISALASSGAGYGGIITPESSAPASLDQATFYIAIQPGTYSSFGVTVTEPSIVSYGGGSTLTFTVSPLGLAPAPTVVKLNTGDNPYVLVPLTGTDGMAFTVDIEGGYSGGATEVYAQRWLVNYSTDNGATIYVSGDKVSTGMIIWTKVYEYNGDLFLVLYANTGNLDYVTMAFRDMTGDPVPGVASVASIADYTYSSDAVIIETGSEPDNEDITIDPNNRLKFADRAVAANQKGYVILRKNKTFAEQVTGANTIYEIRYDFDLGGSTVSIPSGCVFRFVGGSISNGTITTNPFRVVADNDVSILKGISFDGSYITNDTIYVDWFDFVTDGITDNLASFKRLETLVNTKGGGNIVFGLNKTYGVLPLVVHRTNVNFTKVHYGLWFEHCNNLDLNLNGSTIKVLGTNTALFGIVNFFNCKAKIHNGILRGDRDVHDYTPYINYAGNSSDNFELIHNLNQMGGDLEIYDLVSEYVCGDGLLVGSATVWSSGTQYEGTYNIHDCDVRYCGRNGITLHSANGVPTVKDTVIHHIGDYDDMPAWNPKAGIDIEFEDGVGALCDLRLTNLVITDCTNRTISTYSNTRVNSFIADGIRSVGMFQVSNIVADLKEVVNSDLRETKGTAYFIGGMVYRGCKITFTKVGAMMYDTAYYDCTITSELEEGQSGVVIIDGNGNSVFNNCSISLDQSSFRYFVFRGCKVVLKQSRLYYATGVNAENTVFEGVIDENNRTGGFASGNTISGRQNALYFKDCEFKDLRGPTSTDAGLHISEPLFDGSVFFGCSFSNVVARKGNAEYSFYNCRFDNLSFSVGTILKARKFYGCTGSILFNNCSATYKEELESCNISIMSGSFPSFSASSHFIIKNSVIKDLGTTTWNNSAADIIGKNSVFSFNKNYTSSAMQMEGCNITGITEAQFKGTKKNCVFAVPFSTSGATANRPTASAVGAGFTYFDTDLGKMIVSNGTDWVNMDGSAL